MSGLLDSIGEWFRNLLINGIISNFTRMFDALNEKAGEIAGTFEVSAYSEKLEKASLRFKVSDK
jgi:hypothetical protein